MNFLESVVESLSVGHSTFLIIAAIIFTFAITFLGETIYKRRQLKRNNRIIGKVIKTQKGSATDVVIEYFIMGQSYITAPFRVYSLPKDYEIPIWVKPGSGMFVKVDLWTENYVWRYFVSGLFILLGFGALLLHALSVM